MPVGHRGHIAALRGSTLRSAAKRMAAHLCEEEFHRVHLAGLGGVVQGRVRLPRVSLFFRSMPATHVFRLRVDVCACGDEQGHNVHVTALRCQVERRVGLWDVSGAP